MRSKAIPEDPTVLMATMEPEAPSPFPVSNLRRRMSGRPGLSRIFKTFYEWLEQFMDVELVAYWNARGPESQIVQTGGTSKASPPEKLENGLMETVRDVMEGPLPRMSHWRRGDWIFHLWVDPPLEKWDRVLIVEKAMGLSVEESNILMRDTLGVLARPMHSALENDRQKRQRKARELFAQGEKSA